MKSKMKFFFILLTVILFSNLLYSQDLDSLAIDKKIQFNGLSQNKVSFIARSFDFGFYTGSNTTDFNDTNTGFGSGLSLDFASVMLRFNTLNGFTVGTKLIEFIGNTGSLFPINVYYPLFFKEKYFKSTGNTVNSPYITLFGSLNPWNQDYNIIMAGIGMNYTILNYQGSHFINHFIPMIDVNVRIGGFYHSEHPYNPKSDKLHALPIGSIVEQKAGLFFCLTFGASTGY